MVVLNDAPIAKEVATNGLPAEPAGNPSVKPETLQPIQETLAYRDRSSVAYELSQQHLGKPRRLKIIAAGAGISGLDLAHAVESGRLQNVELALYEKNAGLGGTWFENRYPGCACDIPSHNYLFTWAPNPKWSSFYVTAPEILAYLEDVADKFNLRKYVTTQRKIVGAHWDEKKQKWLVTSKRTDGRRTVISAVGVDDGEVDDDIVEECDVFINASGYLNNWRWPNVPGREQYKGVLAHTAVRAEPSFTSLNGDLFTPRLPVWPEDEPYPSPKAEDLMDSIMCRLLSNPYSRSIVRVIHTKSCCCFVDGEHGTRYPWKCTSGIKSEIVV